MEFPRLATNETSSSTCGTDPGVSRTQFRRLAAREGLQLPAKVLFGLSVRTLYPDLGGFAKAMDLE